MKPASFVVLISFSSCVPALAAAQELPALPPPSAAPPTATTTPSAAAPPIAAPPSAPPIGEPPIPGAGPSAPPPALGARYEPTPWDAPIGAPKKRRSTGMMIGGIVMSAVGGLGVIGGIVDYAAAEQLCDAFDDGSIKPSTCVDMYRGIGIAGMVVGGLLIAVGLPLGIYGAGKVAPASPASARRVPSPAAPGAAFPLSLQLGRSDAAFRWSF